jgi:hypothetical protein
MKRPNHSDITLCFVVPDRAITGGIKSAKIVCDKKYSAKKLITRQKICHKKLDKRLEYFLYFLVVF